MKLTKATTELICELEYLIGNECYNPNSTNGYTGEVGRYFRYPVWYKDKNGKDRSTRYKITDVDKSNIGTIEYMFGSNHLHIGNAIIEVLEKLETKYGLDFNELTKKTTGQSNKSTEGILQAKVVVDSSKITGKF